MISPPHTHLQYRASRAVGLALPPSVTLSPRVFAVLVSLHPCSYVIGWSTVVFGINSTSNAVRKCKIAQGEAECYLLPDCIASAINPKYHFRPSYHRLILHLSYITVVFLVLPLDALVKLGASLDTQQAWLVASLSASNSGHGHASCNRCDCGCRSVLVILVR